MDFKDKIVKELGRHIKSVKDVKLEVPRLKKFGDYAFACFELAKKKKKNPDIIAKELGEKLSKKFKVNIVGAYINFIIDKKKLAKDVISEILNKKQKYGCINLGKGKKILVEHTSINPNASPHVGRARNALIGDSLVRILRFCDYKPETHFFVNDVGKQIAMLVYGAKGKISFKDLLKTYIRINKKIEEDTTLNLKIFELLNKLEKGDKVIKNKFRNVVETCVKGQKKIFNELGIKYDYFDYESKYLWNKKTEEILRKLEKTGNLFVDKDKRKIVDMDGYNLSMRTPFFVLTRGDGTSLYGLRDLAYTIEKMERCKENIIVLGEEQKLYFRQLEIALGMLKRKAPRVVHYSFVLLKGGKRMATRKGELVLLEDFMKEAIKKAKEELRKRKSNLKNAKKIAYGAIKYGILKIANEKNVIFDWDEALNFEGDSGPYIQYAYARACNILNKVRLGKPNFNILSNDYEFNLVKKLGEFKDVIEKSCKELRPNLIANYVYDLAKVFNEFYEYCNVIRASKEIKNARGALVKATKYVLKSGLNLLGIDVLEKM